MGGFCDTTSSSMPWDSARLLGEAKSPSISRYDNRVSSSTALAVFSGSTSSSIGLKTAFPPLRRQTPSSSVCDDAMSSSTLFRCVLCSTVSAQIYTVENSRISGRSHGVSTQVARPDTVFTHDEVHALLTRLTAMPHLMVSLLYGAGLPLMACVRLRVKDANFTYHQITVRARLGNAKALCMGLTRRRFSGGMRRSMPCPSAAGECQAGRCRSMQPELRPTEPCLKTTSS